MNYYQLPKMWPNETPQDWRNRVREQTDVKAMAAYVSFSYYNNTMSVGLDVPPWECLPERVKNAWKAAAMAVYDHAAEELY